MYLARKRRTRRGGARQPSMLGWGPEGWRRPRLGFLLWHSVALSGRQDQTERARLRYGGHTPPAPVDSTAGRGGGGAYTAKPLRLESVLIMGRKMY